VQSRYGPPGALLEGVLHSWNDTIWLFKNESQLQQYPGTRCWYDVQSYPIAGVVERLSQPAKYGYFYINLDPSSLGEQLKADVQPTSILSPFAPGNVTTEQYQLVWLGSAGVTTQMHYDTDFNFNLQVTGKKRFLLLPPSFHNRVHVFPRPHQNHRRSQIDWSTNANDASWALAEQLANEPGAVEVTLTKGDVLYLPPFWLHLVTNVNAGISVNVWTELTEHKKLLFAVRTAIPPFHGHHNLVNTDHIAVVSSTMRQSFYSVYLDMVMQFVFPLDTSEQRYQRVLAHYEQRFEWLTQSDSIAKQYEFTKKFFFD
jgi:hypothetical protein